MSLVKMLYQDDQSEEAKLQVQAALIASDMCNYLEHVMAECHKRGKKKLSGYLVKNTVTGKVEFFYFDSVKRHVDETGFQDTPLDVIKTELTERLRVMGLYSYRVEIGEFGRYQVEEGFWSDSFERVGTEKTIKVSLKW